MGLRQLLEASNLFVMSEMAGMGVGGIKLNSRFVAVARRIAHTSMVGIETDLSVAARWRVKSV